MPSPFRLRPRIALAPRTWRTATVRMPSRRNAAIEARSGNRSARRLKRDELARDEAGASVDEVVEVVGRPQHGAAVHRRGVPAARTPAPAAREAPAARPARAGAAQSPSPRRARPRAAPRRPRPPLATRRAPRAHAMTTSAPPAASSASASDVSVISRPGTRIPCQPGSTSNSQRYGNSHCAHATVEAERQHREHEHRDAEPDPQPPAQRRPADTDDRERERPPGPGTASARGRSPACGAPGAAPRPTRGRASTPRRTPAPGPRTPRPAPPCGAPRGGRAAPAGRAARAATATRHSTSPPASVAIATLRAGRGRPRRHQTTATDDRADRPAGRAASARA